MSQHPSVGRIVHYVARGSADGRFPSVCRAAIITEVADMVSDGYSRHPDVANTMEAVGLCVLNPTGMFFHPLEMGGCAHDEDTKEGGTWHWPERVESDAENARRLATDPLPGTFVPGSIPRPDRTVGGAP